MLTIAITQRDSIGCIGVVTDAKPEAIHFYEQLGFVAMDGVREGRMHGDPLPIFLAIDTIANAVQG